MDPMSRALYILLARKFERDDLVIVFSARLDESGTDGRSPYVVVGGAVAAPQQWDILEEKWRALLVRSNVPAFHSKEFNERSEPFKGWGDFKRKRFVQSQEKIIRNNTLFRASVGIDHAVHKKIKERMRGVSGFVPDSDYSLCLRYLMFQIPEQLVQLDPNHKLTILVEDGPWSAGANRTYQRVAAMTGKWKPGRHAHRLAGFASAPKGARPSLEAADYLAGIEHARMLAGAATNNTKTLTCVLTEPLLEQWYEGMIKEKEARRAFAKSKMVDPAKPS